MFKRLVLVALATLRDVITDELTWYQGGNHITGNLAARWTFPLTLDFTPFTWLDLIPFTHVYSWILTILHTVSVLRQI